MKKGQIFILAAIIIGFLLFILVTPLNIIKSSQSLDDDFESISKNYKLESARFVNQVLQEEVSLEEVRDKFVLFSALFTSYSKTKNPNFRLLYILPYKDKIVLGNYLDTSVNFYPGGLIKGCFEDVDTSYSVGGLSIDFGVDAGVYSECFTMIDFPPLGILKFQIEDITYKFKISNDSPEIVVVTRETLGSDRKVFTGGNLITER